MVRHMDPSSGQGRISEKEQGMDVQADRQAQLVADTMPTVAAGTAARGGSGETPDVIRATHATSCEGLAIAPQVRDGGVALAGMTYLLAGDAGAQAWLHVGARLLLRQRPHSADGVGKLPRPIEVQAPDGRRIGQLPPDDAQTVGEFLDAGLSATARVAAVVPAFRRERVQLAIEIRRTAGDPGL
ncbi:hypothetical protein [Roseicella aerolata]|uniref:Uncharacterized protein n=1 Tax=Roseicella aerolata TaxID=2883479 RepID=A0A9X1IHX4_9PROT|nr:hypothetical protein [Roseicella aerolata]MCB4824974.1 hypothetical protein [Roseicella aerolata]